ncbi:MAG: hypothetical protein ABIP68_05950 [Ferruginibacter sp.]
MTRKQLEKLGFKYAGTKLHPNKYFLPHYGLWVMDGKEVIGDIFKRIYENAYNIGVEIGKIEKSDEIKKVLGLTPKEIYYSNKRVTQEQSDVLANSFGDEYLEDN